MTITITGPAAVPALDRIPSNGAMMPHHGTVVEGVLDLTGSGGPAITISADLSQARDHAWLTTHANENRVLPVRTSGQITADAAVGRVAFNYVRNPCGLFGGVMGGGGGNLYRAGVSGPAFDGNGPVSQRVVYVDSRGYPWRVTFALTLNQTTDAITGTATFSPFLHVGSRYLEGETLPIVESISASSMGQAAAIEKTTRLLYLLDQTESGDRALFGTARSWGVGIWEVEISDTIDETGGAYPYAGGLIEFSVVVHVRKSYAAMFGAIAYAPGTVDDRILAYLVATSIGGIGSLVDRDTVLADVGNYYAVLPGDSLPTDMLNYWIGGTVTRTGQMHDRITHANYSNAGALVYWSVDFDYSAGSTGAATASGTQGAGGSDYAGASTLSHTERMDMATKRNGVQVDAAFLDLVTTQENEVSLGAWSADYETTVSSEHFSASGAVADSGAIDFGADEFGTVHGTLIRDEYTIFFKNNYAGTPPLFGWILQADRYANFAEDALSWPNPIPRGEDRPQSGASWVLSSKRTATYSMPWLGWTRYGSNNICGLIEQLAQWDPSSVGDPTTVSAASGANTRLRAIFSPDGSQAPDSTIRALPRIVSGFSWRFDVDGLSGVPAVYDRHAGAWAVAAWGTDRWQRVTLI